MGPNYVDLAGQEEQLLSRTRYGSRLTMLERMAFRAPDSGEAWTRLTSALIDEGEFERAAITSTALEAVAPSGPAHLLRSQALLTSDPQEALRYAELALEATPLDYRSHLQLAKCQFALGDKDRAGLKAAQEAVVLSGGLREVVEMRAALLRLHGHVEEADALLRQGHGTPTAQQIARPASLAAVPGALASTPRSRDNSTASGLILVVLVLLSCINGALVSLDLLTPYAALPLAILLAVAALWALKARQNGPRTARR